MDGITFRFSHLLAPTLLVFAYDPATAHPRSAPSSDQALARCRPERYYTIGRFSQRDDGARTLARL